MLRTVGVLLTLLLPLIMTSCQPDIEDTLRVEAQSSNQDDRLKVARHPRTPLDLLDALSKDSDIYVRIGVANNKNTPSTILESMMADSLRTLSNHTLSYGYPEMVIERIIVNPNSSQSTLDMAAKFIPTVLSRVIEEYPDSLHPDKLAALASFENLHSSLIENANLPTAVLQQLEGSVPDDVFYEAMLRRDDVDSQWLIGLYESASSKRDQVIAERNEKGRWGRIGIGDHALPSFLLVRSIALHKSAPSDLLRRIGESDLNILQGHYRINRSYGVRGNFTPDIHVGSFPWVDDLALEAVAAHLNTPQDLLRELESFEYEPDSNFSLAIRRAATFNPSLAK